jgi:hypothetical protein
MCLIAFAIDAAPDCPLLIAANRDEFFDRPTAALHRWAEDGQAGIWAGRDLRDGGTWLGVSESGRVAMLTNVRSTRAGPGARSRGELATGWLQGSEARYMEHESPYGELELTCPVGQLVHPLVWQTEPFGDWKGQMKRLAEIKIGLRTKFRFATGRNAPHPEHRHWLSYPVTNHSVAPWGNNARLPNTLRFKVRPTQDGKLVGVIFHVPHCPPAQFRPNLDTLRQVWTAVHGFLDQTEQQLTRIPE